MFINKVWAQNVQANVWPVVHSVWVIISLWIPLKSFAMEFLGPSNIINQQVDSFSRKTQIYEVQAHAHQT